MNFVAGHNQVREAVDRKKNLLEYKICESLSE